MLARYLERSTILKSIRSGRLYPHGDGFVDHLAKLGYALGSLPSKLRILCYLSQWLTQQGLEVGDLNEDSTAAFRVAVGDRWRSGYGYEKSLTQFLAYLRVLKVIPEPIPCSCTELDRLIQDFDHFLTEERGLVLVTRSRYCHYARRFMEGLYPPRGLDLCCLTAGDVTDYVLREASRMSPVGAGSVTTALRSFLRFLYVCGLIEIDLAPVVPAVLANRRQTGLPVYLTPEEVEKILMTCDRRTPVGRRNYAMILTLSRLGLRGGEIVRLTLDDVDWNRGELRICGRPGRSDKLPIPIDVGGAIADYLQHGRPQTKSRQVFVRARAPFVGLPRSATVDAVISGALKAANLHPRRQGTYLLRHTVATEMLRRDSSLAEIGELLRHRHPDTTAIYATIDLPSLRGLARVWPEVLAK